MIHKLSLPMMDINAVLVKFQIPEVSGISLSNISTTIASILIQSIEQDPFQTYVYPKTKQYLQLMLGNDPALFPWLLVDQQLTAAVQKAGLSLIGLVKNGKIKRYYPASNNPMHCGFIILEVEFEK